jgi:hypothetical protein
MEHGKGSMHASGWCPRPQRQRPWSSLPAAAERAHAAHRGLAARALLPAAVCPPGLASSHRAGRRQGPPPETREVAGRASIATTTTTTAGGR